MKLFSLLILASVISFQSFAQTSPQLDCHFNFDSYQLDSQTKNSLDSLFSKYRLGISNIFLAGRTDSIGVDNYNKDLASQRINAVSDYLVSKGADVKHVSRKIYGEQNPLAVNATPEGRLQNRSVRVTLTLFEDYTSDVNFIFSRLKPQPATFEVSTNQRSVIHTQGCAITIPPNAFVNAKGWPVNGKVNLEITACLDYYHMLLSNLTTTTTSQQLLETGGMINISVPGNTGIRLRKGAAINVKIAATAMKDSMQLFFPKVDSTGVSWFQPDAFPPTMVFSERLNFNLELLYKESLTKEEYDSLGYLKKELSEGGNSSVLATLLGKLLQARDERKLNQVISRLKIQDVRFMTSIPLRDSETEGGLYLYKASTMRYLSLNDVNFWYRDFKDVKYILYTIGDQRFGNAVDSALNTRRVQIENYVLNMTNLGWMNVDKFFNPEKPAAFFVSADPGFQPVYRLVFKEFRGIVPSFTNEQQPDKGYFKNIPSGTQAILLAYALKDGELYFSSKDIVVGAQTEEKVSLQKTTLRELDNQLAMLK